MLQRCRSSLPLAHARLGEGLQGALTAALRECDGVPWLSNFLQFRLVDSLLVGRGGGGGAGAVDFDFHL